MVGILDFSHYLGLRAGHEVFVLRASWNIWILQDFPGFPGFSGIFLIFFNFYGVPEVREAFRKLPGAGALHSDRIWAHIKPCGPHLS